MLPNGLPGLPFRTLTGEEGQGVFLQKRLDALYDAGMALVRAKSPPEDAIRELERACTLAVKLAFNGASPEDVAKAAAKNAEQEEQRASTKVLPESDQDEEEEGEEEEDACQRALHRARSDALHFRGQERAMQRRASATATGGFMGLAGRGGMGTTLQQPQMSRLDSNRATVRAPRQLRQQGTSVLPMATRRQQRSFSITLGERPSTAIITTAVADLQVGPLFNSLVAMYAKVGRHADVLKYVNIALEPPAPFLRNMPEEIRVTLQMRRGVALAQLAGPTSDGLQSDISPTPGRPFEKPIIPVLKKAEKDLQEVLRYRPKDATILRSLNFVAFLKLQARDVAPLELTGLARLRAMDP
eukprot:TRINITY_DN47668_c0_g1_i1.p1 TRINITY_DN47668_c0_g1~~TRINITY_DN47668_c0_g1_i1.p1  ORF type:complete len:357 (+),score=81.43 TRINITY_DN47668_c0_g1_i1:153-1223(+)